MLAVAVAGMMVVAAVVLVAMVVARLQGKGWRGEAAGLGVRKPQPLFPCNGDPKVSGEDGVLLTCVDRG